MTHSTQHRQPMVMPQSIDNFPFGVDEFRGIDFFSPTYNVLVACDCYRSSEREYLRSCPIFHTVLSIADMGASVEECDVHHVYTVAS